MKVLKHQNRLLRFYNEKGALPLLILIIVVGFLGFLWTSKIFNFKDKLFSTLYPLNKSNASVGNYYDKELQVLKLFGEKKVSETARNKITGNKVYHAAGVVVDKSSNPNKVYVADTGNNRILGFNGIGFCNNQPTLSCTVDSDCGSNDTCKSDGTKGADIVFGQANFEDGSCNRDNNIGVFGKSDADKICFLSLPTNTNIAEAWIKVNFDTDSFGNLYVPDIANNRVLKYNQPFSLDKTEGKGDTLADFVIGQTDFSGVNPNRGTSYTGTLNAPDNQSLNFTNGPSEATGRGVSVDSQGNIWVADALNHRVLRFPPNSKTANLILGTDDFNLKLGCVIGRLNQFCYPSLAKIRPDTNQLYVLDEFGGNQAFSARILVFDQPFRSGVGASKVIIPKDASWTANPYEFFHAMGFEFNPYRVGDLAAGVLWVRDGGKRVLLIDDDGNVIKTINSKDKNSLGGDQAYAGCPYNIYDPNYFMNWDPGGSIGFDKDNNIYLTDDLFHRVSRYNLPTYSFVNINGVMCPPKPNGGLFKGFDANIKSKDSLGEAIGAVVFNNQLIVQDERRIKVWNDYMTKIFGEVADYEISGGLASASLRTNAIDDNNRLWTMNESGQIRIYQLPFTQDNQPPIKDAINLYWADDQGLVNYGGFGGIAFDKVNKKMYLADPPNHRILRFSNYNDFGNGKLLVDMVIGQPDKLTIKCNNNQEMPWLASGNPTANSLCFPVVIKFDNQGNLYVVENTYECHGNDRITVFLSSDLNTASGLFPMIAAKKAFVGTLTSIGPCGPNSIGQPGSPVTLAFNNRNELVIGNDGYYGDITLRHKRQLWYYKDPLNKQTPDNYINLPMGAPGEIIFDSLNNLIVQDHTWTRTWVINIDKDPTWLDLPAVPPAGTNVALNKLVSVSSQAPYAGWEKDKAVDGIPTSGGSSYGWSSEGSILTDHTEWIKIDLGQSQYIDKINLYPRSDLVGEFFPIDFNIQASEDGINWTTLITKLNYPKPQAVSQTFAFNPLNARFVKIEGTKLRPPQNAIEYRMQLAEIEVFNSPTPIVTPKPLNGDVDGNKKVDIFDYNIILTNFGKVAVGYIGGDIDNSGKVDIFDYNIILTNFGKTTL